MIALLVLPVALLFPLTVLGLLLWLAHLEDTLPRDVRTAQRKPEPPPILAIPVRRAAAGPATIPRQRAAPAAEVGTDAAGLPA